MGKKLFVITMLSLLIFTGCGKKEDNKDEKIFKEDLNIQFNSETKISDLLNDKSIELINGHEVIDTSKVGEQEVIIKYVKDEVELEETIIIKIVDTEVPVIQHVNEYTTVVGRPIDMLSNVVVTDNSKEVIKATIEGNYDFNVAGTYYLTYVAVDSSNNKAVSSFILYVIDNGNIGNNDNTGNNGNEGNNGNTGEVGQLYYRYRKKIYNNYECGTYNCSYIDYNDQKAAYPVFKKESPCGGAFNPKINTPCRLGETCIQVMTERYKVKNNVCYDSTYILTEPKTYTKTECSADEIKVNGYCHKIESRATNGKFSETSPCGGAFNPKINTPCPVGETCIQAMTERYKAKDGVCYDSAYIIVNEKITEKTVCGVGEINVDGYCHKIESTAITECEAGYSRINDTTCAKNVSKTCTKTCTTESWGEWSEWSTTKVTPSDSVQVEIKQN